MTRIADRVLGDASAMMDHLLSSALADQDPNVRRLAFAAARGTVLSVPAISAVLLGTRNFDSTTARTAWFVLAELKLASVSDEFWGAIAFTCSKSLNHRDSTVREAAAAAVKNLTSIAPVGPTRSRRDRILTQFTQDRSYAVRFRARS